MKRLILLLSLFAIAPLLHPEYFWGAHDGRHSVYFLVEFDRSIQDGILWPRWAPDFAYGYGYPIFNIYAPLAYFVAEFFHLIGFDFVNSVKIVFGLSIVLSGIAMYWFARDVLGARGALIAAAVYMYAPYRLVDIYVRGALAESVAFVFFPLVLGTFRRLLMAMELRTVMGNVAPSPLPWALLGAASMAALILTHTSMAPLFILITALYIVWWLVRHAILYGAPVALLKTAGWCFGTAVFALTLSAIFWLPMAAEYNDVRTDQWTTADYNINDNFVYPHQLLAPAFDYGLSRPGPDDDMSFQLGIVPVILAAAGIFARRRSSLTERSFFIVLAIGSIFFLMPVSIPVWDMLKAVAGLVQFPWRLLGFAVFALAILAGMAVGDGRDDRTADARDRIGLALLLMVIVFGSYRMLNPPMFPPVEGPVSLGALMRFEQSSGELVGLTRWNKVKPTDSPLKPIYEAGLPITTKVDPATVPPGATASTVRRNSVFEEITINTPESFRLGLYSQHYPGWTATINGAPAVIEPMGDFGLQTVIVPAGQSTLIMRFVDTPPRIAGQVLSGLSVLALLGAAGWLVYRRRRPVVTKTEPEAEPEPVAAGQEVE